ncbi:hypothetical protein DITRI_Ditri05aG0000900 [Diplodiscus trichospermus]
MFNAFSFFFTVYSFRCLSSTYEDSVYCDKFHLEESGWRDCRLCGKHLHCGCIASKYLLELLDYGGVGCSSCVKSSQFCSVRRIHVLFSLSSEELSHLVYYKIMKELKLHRLSLTQQMHGDEIPKGFSAQQMNNARVGAVDGKAVGDDVDERELAQNHRG